MVTPTAITIPDITISGHEGRLWRNGIRLVRMSCMMSVYVSTLSTNQPV